MKILRLTAALLTLLAVVGCHERNSAQDGDSTAGTDRPAATSGSDGVATTDVPPEPTGAATDAVASGAEATGAGTTGDAATASAGDAELLGVLAAINQHEIDTANQAKQHKLSPDVARFADMMLADHGANLEKSRALGANEQAPKAMALAKEGEQKLQELGKQPDAAYAKAYVDAMVTGHSEALATLDDQLIPAATSEPVKAHLQQTRTKVADHLKHAQDLQAKL